MTCVHTNLHNLKSAAFSIVSSIFYASVKQMWCRLQMPHPTTVGAGLWPVSCYIANEIVWSFAIPQPQNIYHCVLLPRGNRGESRCVPVRLLQTCAELVVAEPIGMCVSAHAPGVSGDTPPSGISVKMAVPARQRLFVPSPGGVSTCTTE